MSWRVATSLLVLRDQIDSRYPGRDKSSDGTIGDERHQLEVSEHNPDRYGIVRAMDITNDPNHGLLAEQLADALIASHDARIRYVISCGRIASSTKSPWMWRPYTGTDPHTGHMHISVVADIRADNNAPWNLGTGTSPEHPAWPGRYLQDMQPMMHGQDVVTWQQRMHDRGWNLAIDGWYGPRSSSCCHLFQAEKGLPIDGIVGPVTWDAAWTAPVTS